MTRSQRVFRQRTLQLIGRLDAEPLEVVARAAHLADEQFRVDRRSLRPAAAAVCRVRRPRDPSHAPITVIGSERGWEYPAPAAPRAVGLAIPRIQTRPALRVPPDRRRKLGPLPVEHYFVIVRGVGPARVIGKRPRQLPSGPAASPGLFSPFTQARSLASVGSNDSLAQPAGNLEIVVSELSQDFGGIPA